MVLNGLLLLFYVSVSAFGLYHMKAASQFGSGQFILGFGAYVVGFGIWLFILTRAPLSSAFPIAAGSLIVATQFTGYFFLSERITPMHAIGIAAILAGILLVSRELGTANG